MDGDAGLFFEEAAEVVGGDVKRLGDLFEGEVVLEMGGEIGSDLVDEIVMGIAAALYERRITDPKSGAFVNAELADYKLARLGDIGELVIEIYEPESERQRGVIGNGEPPAISPIAAISNAVANALGVRIPVIPLTPKRVLDALAKV